MCAQRLYRRTHEQHRFDLQARQDDFVRRAYDVDVRRHIRDGKIALAHHSQVNVKRFPKLLGALRRLPVPV